MPIEWNDKLSVGNEAIDEDHKRLVKIMNEYEVAVDHHDIAHLEKVFQKLYNYTEGHFEREEKLMEAVHFQHIREHKRSHQKMKSQIHEIHEALVQRKRNGLKIKDTNKLLHDWIVVHLIQEDMQLKP